MLINDEQVDKFIYLMEHVKVWIKNSTLYLKK